VVGRRPKQDGICDVDGVPLVLREDDREAVIPRRLKIYEERTLPVVAHYRTRGRLVPVDGNRPVDAVVADVLATIEGQAA
jgi:adenylate kinase